MLTRPVISIAAAMTLMSVVATAQDSATRSTPPRPPRSEQTQVIRETEVQQNAHRQTGRQLAEQLGWELAATNDGLRIERIVRNSPIARARLQEQDLIVEVGGEHVTTTDRLVAILHDLRDAQQPQAEIVVLRDGEELSYLLPLETLEPLQKTTETRATTTTTSNGDLVQMVRQLQIQSQEQQELLQTVLLELQSLRLQIAGTPDADGAVIGAEVENNTVTAPGQPPTNPGTGNRPGTRSGNP